MSSVVLAEGYMNDLVGLGALVSGLLANTGYGIIIIFKELSLKYSLKIMTLLLAIGIFWKSYYSDQKLRTCV